MLEDKKAMVCFHITKYYVVTPVSTVLRAATKAQTNLHQLLTDWDECSRNAYGSGYRNPGRAVGSCCSLHGR